MRIAICDDEPRFAAELADLIQNQHRSLDLVVDSYSSGEDLLYACQQLALAYALIFLDIEMGGMDGLRTAKALAGLYPAPMVVFVTSHDELACDGYEVAAFRFLTKPVNEAKLAEAVVTARNRLQQAKTVLLKNGEGEFVLPLDSILYIEAQNQQVLVVSQNVSYSQRTGIGQYEQDLAPDGFCLIHRSYLVNLRHVKALQKQEVLLTNGQRLPLSRLRQKDFACQFHQYIQKTAF